MRTAGKPKQARRGSTRVSPSSAGASSTTSAHSSAGRLVDAAASAGFACFSVQPWQLPSLQGCFFVTPSLRFPSRRGVASESNPLLKVSPAGRGNRTCAPSRSGETSAPSRFPSRSGETSAPTRFPSRSGGNLKEGGQSVLARSARLALSGGGSFAAGVKAHTTRQRKLTRADARIRPRRANRRKRKP